MKKLFLFLIILFFVGVLSAANCMTSQQVQSERTKCLFIYNNQIYWYGSYGHSHQGHSCGSDVTSVMESSHISRPSFYLTPYYYADICAGCTPSCSNKQCGDDGCGGICGNCGTGYTCQTNGTCVINTCVPNCAGKNCGDDGCGGSCGNCSTGTCNSTGQCIVSCVSSWNCGNWSDCTKGVKTRICNDINNCSVKTNNPSIITNCTNIQNQTNSTSNITNNSKKDSAINQTEKKFSIKSLFALIPPNTMGITGRITGMLAFLLLALSIFGAIYKIKYHKLISYTAIILVVIHLISLLNDESRWGKILTIINSLFPNFGNPTLTNISLGIIAFYLMLIGILGCLFFKFLIKKVGFKAWKWIHRLSLPAYVLVYIHALKIGTDFRIIWYQLPFILIFILIFGKYLLIIFKKNFNSEKEIQPVEEQVQTTSEQLPDMEESISSPDEEIEISNQIKLIKKPILSKPLPPVLPQKTLSKKILQKTEDKKNQELEEVLRKLKEMSEK